MMLRLATLALALTAVAGCTGPVECVASFADSSGNDLGTASFEYEDLDVDAASEACTEDAAAEAPAGTVSTSCSCNE